MSVYSRLRLLALVANAVVVRAQEPMTVTGRVTIGDRPLSGASIQLSESPSVTKTNTEGWYSFLIPAARVRGQIATITARHGRYGSRSSTLALVGGSVVRDFTFDVSTSADGPTPAAGPIVRRREAPRKERLGRAIDAGAFDEIAGPVDIVSALDGRFTGLLVNGANGLGASSLSIARGPRSITGPVQPLVVIDGVVADNSSFSTATQRFGLGGFDYGSPLQDISLHDIASVRVVTGADAVARYGARGANGAIVVTSKSGRETPGFAVTANVYRTTETPLRLPRYQNAYGQGLGGQFEFLNGLGGGINDAVDQSWGPALHGQLIPQASLTEARHADVRPWAPHPDGVRDYFSGARTIDAAATVEGASRRGTFRVSLDGRDARGLTPSNQLRRLSTTVHAAVEATPRLTLALDARLLGSQTDDRPGTGYDEINSIAGFTRLGRQVDLSALRQRAASGDGSINWIYLNHNNPFVQSLINSNRDQRGHLIAGTQASYELGNGLRFVGAFGSDANYESRNFDVAPAWRGGYPTALGRMDFAEGGAQRQSLNRTQTTASAGLQLTHSTSGGSSVFVDVGADHRSDSHSTNTVVLADSARGSASESVVGGRATTAIVLRDRLHLAGGVRAENIPGVATQAFPHAALSLDMLGRNDSRSGPRLTARGAWWRAGSAFSTVDRAQLYGDAARPAAPEITQGTELGLDVSVLHDRGQMAFTAYDERSSNVRLGFGATAAATAASGARVSNRGVELAVRATLLQRVAAEWDVSTNFSRNRNRVESLAPGVDEVELGPALWGASLVARAGEPLGTIVGTRLLRDAGGALVLRDGVPLATQARSALGTWQPDWMMSVTNDLRVHGLDFSVSIDGRKGGRVFSATNLWGSYAGTLETTVNRPTSGIMLGGVDSVTKSSNAAAVSAEAYYHALARIHEPWVFDASFVKIRDLRISYTFPLAASPVLREQSIRASLIGRNLFAWAKAPNIDPETTLSTSGFQGFEMGQLPTTRSIGLQLTLTP